MSLSRKPELYRNQIIDVLVEMFGFNVEQAEVDKDSTKLDIEDFYFEVWYEEDDIVLQGSLSLDNRWVGQVPNLNGLQIKAYLPRGLNPVSHRNELEEKGLHLSKGNSQWILGMDIRSETVEPVAIERVTLETSLDLVFDSACQLVVDAR